MKNKECRQKLNLVYTVMAQGVQIKVCCLTFFSSHDVSEKSAHNTLKKCTPTGTVGTDMRGTHTHRFH